MSLLTWPPKELFLDGAILPKYRHVQLEAALLLALRIYRPGDAEVKARESS